MKSSEIVKAQSKPVGELKPSMTRRQKVIVAIIAVICILLGFSISYLSTAQVKDLKQDGKNYTTLVPGSPGLDGKSAYDLAVDNGFQGTEEEWLETLEGDSGPAGLSAYQLAQIQGYLGSQTEWLDSLVGDRGRSAYEIALDNGFKGSQLVWLASLVGAKGDRGDQGQPGEAGMSAYAIAVLNGFNGTEQQWLASLKGEIGQTGATGATGANGNDGRDPVISCILRESEQPPTRYIAWKYQDETDSQYRNLYKLPVWAEGENCVAIAGGA